MFMPLFLLVSLVAGYNLHAADSNNNSKAATFTSPDSNAMAASYLVQTVSNNNNSTPTDQQKWLEDLSDTPKELKTKRQQNWYKVLSSIKNWKIPVYSQKSGRSKFLTERAILKYARHHLWSAKIDSTRNDIVFNELTPDTFEYQHGWALLNGYRLCIEVNTSKHCAIISNLLYNQSLNNPQEITGNLKMVDAFTKEVTRVLYSVNNIDPEDEGPLFNNSDDEQDRS
jgi:hypothetical protein